MNEDNGIALLRQLADELEKERQFVERLLQSVRKARAACDSSNGWCWIPMKVWHEVCESLKGFDK